MKRSIHSSWRRSYNACPVRVRPRRRLSIAPEFGPFALEPGEPAGLRGASNTEGLSRDDEQWWFYFVTDLANVEMLISLKLSFPRGAHPTADSM